MLKKNILSDILNFYQIIVSDCGLIAGFEFLLGSLTNKFSLILNWIIYMVSDLPVQLWILVGYENTTWNLNIIIKQILNNLFSNK